MASAPDRCGDIENFVDIEIGLTGRRSADRIGFVGLAYVQRSAVYIGINHDRGNSHFVARAQDAHRDLAAIGYQNFLEHCFLSNDLRDQQRAGERTISSGRFRSNERYGNAGGGAQARPAFEFTLAARGRNSRQTERSKSVSCLAQRARH